MAKISWNLAMIFIENLIQKMDGMPNLANLEQKNKMTKLF